jgi:8-oxo-dGTP pyrophosphatase MutT (NUDIX family)
MLKKLRKQLELGVQPELQQGSFPRQAAVLMALTDNESDPTVVLTKRAEHLSSHSGEVSLPGGKWEIEDDSLLTTALRETHEEIGLESHLIEVLSSLPTLQTWQGMKVTPFVGVVPEALELTPNEGELDAIFHVPLRFFLEDNRIRTDLFPYKGANYWSPAYSFEGYEVWGFTARLMVNFLNDYVGANIQCDNSAPIKDWSREQENYEKRLAAIRDSAE